MNDVASQFTFSPKLPPLSPHILSLFSTQCAHLTFSIFMSHFIRQTSFEVDYAPARISKWKSARTGLQLTYIDQPSPVVNGYFAVATEIEDDSGCPHTLEHLVFMGSKKFPYKGLLDSLGNRFFSSTNAWTAVDQTVYTLTTAGWEGFKTLLPIYLDHLLNPTLTDEACLTEVYHIDGNGKEKGVVFSEMQGIESQSWFISYLTLQKALYDKSSGYSSETGGLMAELRHLTNDQIRQFHKNMYHANNLCVVITGSVDEEELLAVMAKFDSELAPLPSIPQKRPFVDSAPVEPLKKSIKKRVEFPDKDESMGEIVIGWIGPESGATLENMAVDMVGSYLTDSPISLLNKHLVEIEDPLATEIDYGTDDYSRTGLNLTLSGVPTDKLDFVDAKIKLLLSEQALEENFDLSYMRQVVNQQKLKFVASTEKSANTFSNIAILEFVYGNLDGSDLAKWSKDLREFDVLANWSAAQWCKTISQYFVENNSASIIGVPSATLNDSVKAKNKERAKEIREKYGEDGLAKLGKALEAAQKMNDTVIPDEVLVQFGKPDPSKIEFIETDSYPAGSNDLKLDIYRTEGQFVDILAKDTPNNFPLYLHFEDYKSQFATIHLVMSSSAVPAHLLKYFSVIEEIFSLSIKLPDGQYMPYEEVIAEINDDLIEFQFDNGFDSHFVELMSVKVKFEVKKYDKAIQWLINVLKYSVFEESRLRVIIEKIINSLPDKKRNDELMMYSCEYRTVYTDGSVRKAQDSINTENFYKELLRKLDNGKYAEIEADLNSIKNHLFNISNMKAIIIGGCTELERPVSMWNTFVETFTEVSNNAPQFDLANFPRSFQFKTAIGVECARSAFLVSSSAGETTHLISLTPIPTDYLNEDIFKIALASEFLGGVEGPFWRGIRGTGLAYGANIRRLIESGYLSFSIYRGADAQQAWTTGKKIITDYISGEHTIDAISIENSIAAIVNELANGEANPYDAATTKIIDNIFKKRGSQYIKFFLERLNTYTNEDLVYVMKKYFLPLFEAESSLIFSCLPTTATSGFVEFLQGEGYKVSVEEIATSAREHGDSDSGSGSECDTDCSSCEESDED